MGWSGSGQCLTRNQPNHFGSPIFGSDADRQKESIRVVRCLWVLGFKLCETPYFVEIGWFLPKSVGFCQILKRSVWISIDKTKKIGQPLKSEKNRKFPVRRWSSRLKINFSCLDLTTDQSLLGFGGRDPLSTIIGFWVERVGRVVWVIGLVAHL